MLAKEFANWFASLQILKIQKHFRLESDVTYHTKIMINYKHVI